VRLEKRLLNLHRVDHTQPNSEALAQTGNLPYMTAEPQPPRRVERLQTRNQCLYTFASSCPRVLAASRFLYYISIYHHLHDGFLTPQQPRQLHCMPQGPHSKQSNQETRTLYSNHDWKRSFVGGGFRGRKRSCLLPSVCHRDDGSHQK
jgi:hypothetical protein